MRVQETVHEVPPTFAVTLGLDGEIKALSQSAAELLEVSKEEVLGANWFDTFVPEEQKDAVASAFLRLIASDGAEQGSFTNDVVTRSGKKIRLDWQSVLVEANSETHAISIGRPAAASRDNEQIFSAIFTSAVESLIFSDRDGVIRLVNPAAEKMFGWSRDEMIGRNVTILMPAMEAAGHDAHMQRFIDDGTIRVIGKGRELMGKHRTGSVFPIFLSVAFVDCGGQSGFVASIRNITEQKQAELREHQLAYYCPLTNLANKESMAGYLEAIAERRGEDIYSLVQVAVKRFSLINSVHGRRAGDAVLLEIAKRLKAFTKKDGAFLCRSSGDEFITIFLDDEECSKAEELAQAIRLLSVAPVDIGTTEINVELAIGIVQLPYDGMEPDILLRNLASAVLESKNGESNPVVRFNSEIQRKIKRHYDLETRLKAAVEDFTCFSVYFQPKHRSRTGELVGAEALLRWQDEQLGNIPPSEFIPVAEATGLINPLGEWVLLEALKVAQTVKESILPDFHIAVNCSAQQFRSGNLLAAITELLKKNQLDPTSLQVELTEGSLIDDTSSTVRLLSALKTIGVTVAIDDFGTGFSSLSYLKQFPLDVLKVDKSFVDGIPNTPTDCAILESIVTLCHALDFRVVAEGVEQPEQARYLERLGCDQLQGYLFSKPLPAPLFLDYARRAVSGPSVENMPEA